MPQLDVAIDRVRWQVSQLWLSVLSTSRQLVVPNPGSCVGRRQGGNLEPTIVFFLEKKNKKLELPQKPCSPES